MRDIFSKSIIVILLLLTGCATTAQRQFQSMNQTVATAATELKTCMSEVWDLPEAAPVRDHEPLDIRDATLDQETDDHKVTPKEATAIKFTHPKITECRKTALTKIEGPAPGIAAILANEMQKQEDQLIALLKKKISWGEYITNRKAAAIEAQTQLAAEHQRIMSGLERSHEAELARRQQATNALMQLYETQQVVDAMNRPRLGTATCTGMGNTVNCIGVSQ